MTVLGPDGLPAQPAEPTGLEGLTDEQLLARDAAESAEMAANLPVTPPPPVDPHAGKVNLAGHWVGPQDLIPLALPDCPEKPRGRPPRGCGGSGVIAKTLVGPAGPLIQREVCPCCIEAFLAQHVDDLRKAVTVPGEPVIRLPKKPRPVRQHGAAADERIPRLLARRGALAEELAAVAKRQERAEAPRRKAIEKLRRMSNMASDDRDRQVRYLVGIDDGIAVLEQEIAWRQTALSERREERAQAVGEASAKASRLARINVRALALIRGLDPIAARYPERLQLSREIDKLDRKIATIRAYAGQTNEEPTP